MNIGKENTIYFLGIGGIGMSALARYFQHLGAAIFGYDRTVSPLTQLLENEGMTIHYEDNPDLLPSKIDLVIYTPAVHADNQEFIALKNRGVDMKKRAEVLGILSEDYFTIAIAGTHGKTTTTAMTAHILKSAGLSLIGFIGGISNNFNGNLVLGDGKEDIMVVEADEFDRSFLHLHPDIEVITSMDADHLDIYKAKEQLVESFQLFADNLGELGLLIYRNGLEINTEKANISYGLDETCGIYAENIRIENGKSVFTICFPDLQKVEVNLSLPGKHNVLNALAAAEIASELDIKPQKIAEYLSEFKGVRRRFDVRVNTEFHYVDDYAHHPEEIKSTLLAARELFPDKKLTLVFQPHLFTRTRDFMEGFAESLSMADKLILLDIYPARENPIEGITSSALLDKVSLSEKQLCSAKDLLNIIDNQKPELLITMGAGDIDRFVEPLEKMIQKW